MIQLSVIGTPKALARPRVSSRGGFPRMYDSQTKEKGQTLWQLKPQYSEAPLAGPLAIDLVFAMPIPKSASNIRRRLMIEGELYHIFRPDLDNLSKFILDCMNGFIYIDDSQIQELHARKIYSTIPSTLIRVVPVEEAKIKPGKREATNESDCGDC